MMPRKVAELLDDLKQALKADDFNLARDDQDALELAVEKLEQTIEERYDARQPTR